MGDHEDSAVAEQLPGLPVAEPPRYDVAGVVTYKQIKCVEAQCKGCGKTCVLMNPHGAEKLEQGQQVLIRCGGCGAFLVMTKGKPDAPRIVVPRIQIAKR